VLRLHRGPIAALTAAVCAAGLAAVAPLGAASAADPDPAPSAVLADARAALTEPGGRDTTLALTDLRLAYPRLSTAEQAAADALLARPTDGAADPQGFGYTVPEAAPVCGPHVCVHYVPTTSDAPAPADADADGVPDWVQTTLTTMESVLAFHTGTLGYRAPAPDGSRGGSALFDVYLSQIGDDGLYGFCAPEERVPGQKFVYSGYCVLDQDFTEFPQGALASLEVTAAHEFFHAVQFDYDAAEDRWFMEATATWVEERYADLVDDNRQYLRYGQLRRPKTPLDQFDAFGQSQYGNWLFFELLSKTYGIDAVRRVWERADATKGARDDYSIAAVSGFLRSRKKELSSFYARFATVNQQPGRYYEEGAAYRAAPVSRKVRLRTSRPRVTDGKRLDHLTSAAYRLVPAASLPGRLRLRVAVSGPSRATGAAASLLVRDDSGRSSVRTIKLGADGQGAKTLSLEKVSSVTVVLTNGSTRFDCWQEAVYSCQGEPKDDNLPYAFTASLVR
jgi:hypothetical protein